MQNPYVAREQARWLRPDAARWIRPDAARFFKPGTKLEDVFPALARKYSPNQPRVPAGNPDGGQWTDGEGGAGRLAQPMGNIGITDRRIISDADPESIKPGTQYAQVGTEGTGGRPVDLLKERESGGHTIERHVGRSPESLYRAVRDSIDATRRRGDGIDGATESSFSSLEAANKLVNATIAQNPERVGRVARGISPKETLDAYFSSPTGIEAYAKNERSQTVIRDTYGVRVIIVPDKSAQKGYRNDTAFPRSFR